MRRIGFGIMVGVACAALSGAASCGGNGTDSGGGGTGSGGGSASGGGLSVGTGGSGATCTSSAQCTGGAICHPYSQSCVTPGPGCTESAECPLASYCEPTLDVCLPGESGSPCESDDNCVDTTSCTDGTCGCSEFSQEQEESAGPLDVYFVLDRTGSMGQDCEYERGESPPVDSKACFATYSVSDYLIDVDPEVDTRLAFQFMSYPDGCDGGPYSEPLVDLTSLPLAEDHTIIQEISDENFAGGFGTDIEGALRGIAAFTEENRTEGREMIGVLMTDGDPEGCEENIDDLAEIIADHYEATGIRTFIIGMEGATEDNLEQLARAGGAEPHDDFCGELAPPCHYWNVGDGSGSAIASALTAIQEQAVPLPCEYPLSGVVPPGGQMLDLSTLNVRLTEGDESTLIVRAPSKGACPTDQAAWYYDDPDAPMEVRLCPVACERVTNAEAGARVSIVGGCTETQVLR